MKRASELWWHKKKGQSEEVGSNLVHELSTRARKKEEGKKGKKGRKKKKKLSTGLSVIVITTSTARNFVELNFLGNMSISPIAHRFQVLVMETQTKEEGIIP